MKKNIIMTAKIIVVVMSILLVSGIITGCSNDTNNSDADEKSATLMGTVLDKSNGAFVEDASITISGKVDKTDGSGDFMIADLSLGEYTVTASKTGYQDYSTTVNLVDGVNEIEISLTPVTQ